MSENISDDQVVSASDEGGLSNTAVVEISLTDVNDQSPEWEGLPYTFR